MAKAPSTYNTSLDQVPASIQAELRITVDEINKSCENVVMIWLFGSYARGEAINDRRLDPETGTMSEYHSDVDVLVITQGIRINDVKTEKKWHKLADRLENHPEISSHIHLIYESLERVNEALSYREYFYHDVITEGIVLFNDSVTLAKPRELSAADRRARSIDYLNELYEQANGFKQGVELYYQLDNYRLTMFSLHQMTEHLFKTYLLVFTHYKPRTHDLMNMLVRVATIDSTVENIFPRTSEEEEDRFTFFVNSYVNARYKLDYQVEPEVLDYLIARVAEFQQWMLPECLKKIDSFVPENNFSKNFVQTGEFLDLDKLKNSPLPQALVYQQLEALKLKVEEIRIKDEILEQKDKNLRTKERRLKLERKEKREALERERKLREEHERLIKKLKDAGLEP